MRKEWEIKKRNKVEKIIKVKVRNKVKLREVFISDIHIPYEDEKCISFFLDFLSEEKFDLLWIGGDLIDFYAVSSWIIDITEANINKEIFLARDFLESVRRRFKGKVVYQEGNHEERLIKYIFRRARELAPLFKYDLRVANLLGLEGLRIEYRQGIQKVGKLYHLHGHEKRMMGQVVHIALNMLRWLQRSYVCGHFHRFNFFPLREVDKSWKAGWTSGCMFDIKRMPTPYEYVDLNQKGFLVIEYDDEGYYYVRPVMFIEKNGGYKVYWDGEFYQI